MRQSLLHFLIINVASLFKLLYSFQNADDLIFGSGDFNEYNYSNDDDTVSCDRE